MKVVFKPQKAVNVVASMACKCSCKNVYSSAPGMKIPH